MPSRPCRFLSLNANGGAVTALPGRPVAALRASARRGRTGARPVPFMREMLRSTIAAAANRASHPPHCADSPADPIRKAVPHIYFGRFVIQY